MLGGDLYFFRVEEFFYKLILIPVQVVSCGCVEQEKTA